MRKLWMLLCSVAVAMLVLLAPQKGGAQLFTCIVRTQSGGVAASCAIPAPTSTPTPSCCFNATEFPVGFTPFAATSIWNRPFPHPDSTPTLYPSSDTIIANNIQAGDGQQFWVQNPGVENHSHPWYFATNTDPLVHTFCTTFCNTTYPQNTNGADIRIPHFAWTASGGDDHETIVQPDGTEVDTFGTSSANNGNWNTGNTLTASTITNVGNFYTGSGVGDPSHSATVGDVALAGGQITEAEAASGTINHALAFTMRCGDPTAFVYPAQQVFDDRSAGCPPNGAHLWLDLTDTQVAALSLSGTTATQTVQRAILKALHHYGGYLMDSGQADTRSHEPDFLLESGYSFSAFGATAPWVTFAQNNGWTVGSVGGITTWTMADPWLPLGSGGWAAHLHIAAECYALGTC